MGLYRRELRGRLYLFPVFLPCCFSYGFLPQSYGVCWFYMWN